jgi:hypothetical protein
MVVGYLYIDISFSWFATYFLELFLTTRDGGINTERASMVAPSRCASIISTRDFTASPPNDCGSWEMVVKE